MSLLGRLEDLSLTDIVQIVYLSRRTGVLEILDSAGRHTVLFRHGLVVNASSPNHPDLITYLHNEQVIGPDPAATLRRLKDAGLPSGTAAIELNLIRSEELAEAIRRRILNVFDPLLQSREGEFSFILSESMGASDIEYDPDVLFRERGFAPQKILGASEGVRIKPLQGLEESVRAGRSVLGADDSDEETESSNLLPSVMQDSDGVAPFPSQVQAPSHPAPESETKARERGTEAKFRVAGGLFEIENPETGHWNIVLYERNPLVRVAARRAFERKGVKVAQYGAMDDVREAVNDLMQASTFFVPFLELPEESEGEEATIRLVKQIKRRNARLPVVIVDAQADGRRRQEVLAAGGNVYLRKPSPDRLQPEKAEEELSLFAEELVLLADRAFQQLENVAGGHDPEAGKRFYELAEKDNLDRRFSMLERLITELSDPDDIEQVASTILRLAAEYLDRGALFLVTASDFVGLGGFGVTGGGAEMDGRVKDVRIPRGVASILADVAGSRLSRRGKMRRTPANLSLIEALGTLVPTRVVVLPILQGGQPIGILYGDNAEHRAGIDALTGLEIFLSQAGSAFGSAAQAWERAHE